MHGLVNRRVTNKDVQLQNRLVEFTKPPIETGDLIVKRDLTVGRDTHLNHLHVAGNLDVSGTILAAQFLPGQVVNTLMLSNANIGQYVNTGQTYKTIAAGSTVTLFNYAYTPVIANSYLLIEYQSIYSLIGSQGDSIWAYLYTTDDSSDNRIGQTYQQWNNGIGGGTRSGTIFPIIGRYTNTDTSLKTIRVDIYNATDADTITVNSDISTWLKITEIGR